MTPVPRSVVEAFYHALSIRDMAAPCQFSRHNVVWTISGLVDCRSAGSASEKIWS
jgi:ketosteroid isomerase-like protein